MKLASPVASATSINSSSDSRSRARCRRGRRRRPPRRSRAARVVAAPGSSVVDRAARRERRSPSSPPSRPPSAAARHRARRERPLDARGRGARAMNTAMLERRDDVACFIDRRRSTSEHRRAFSVYLIGVLGDVGGWRARGRATYARRGARTIYDTRTSPPHHATLATLVLIPSLTRA